MLLLQHILIKRKSGLVCNSFGFAIGSVHKRQLQSSKVFMLVHMYDRKNQQCDNYLTTLPRSTSDDMTSLWRIPVKVSQKFNTSPPFKYLMARMMKLRQGEQVPCQCGLHIPAKQTHILDSHSLSIQNVIFVNYPYSFKSTS